jgi:hypothetical protein
MECVNIQAADQPLRRRGAEEKAEEDLLAAARMDERHSLSLFLSASLRLCGYLNCLFYGYRLDRTFTGCVQAISPFESRTFPRTYPSSPRIW